MNQHIFFRKSSALLVATSVSTVAFLSSCGDNKGAQQGPPVMPPVNVSVLAVEPGNATYFDEYPAIVVAENQTELRAQVTGYITGIYFKDGDKVRKGQRLYTIDAQLYSANKEQAVANLQVQETNMLKAERDLERYRELDKKEAIAKQQLDYAEAAYDAAKKQVAAAKANVNALAANVGFTTIVAPFSGTIGISMVREGTAVVAGQTVLNTVSTDNPMAVDVVIDQKDVFRFSKLQQTGAKATDSLFTLSFGADIYPGTGRISIIDRAVDPQTGTIKVRLLFANAEGLLRPGMNGRLNVKSASSEPKIVIPFKAVTEQLGSYFVYQLGDSSKVTQKKVTLGRQIGGNVVIEGGLTAGEKIVVEGIQSLREGAVVNVSGAQEVKQ